MPDIGFLTLALGSFALFALAAEFLRRV